MAGRRPSLTPAPCRCAPGPPAPPARRAGRAARQQHAVAPAAAARVRPGSVIGRNGATPTTALAHELASRQDFRDAERATVLVTNAVSSAQELAVRRHLQLVVTGGVVRESSYELVGTWAEQRLEIGRASSRERGEHAG